MRPLQGLAVLRAAGVFNCHDSWEKAVANGELRAAHAIYDAGYSIDSLQLRYEVHGCCRTHQHACLLLKTRQGVDWRHEDATGCNGGLQPIQNGLYDGGSVHPLETMFVKVKASMLAANWTGARDAAQYDRWALEQALPTASRLQLLKSNHFLESAPQRLRALKQRGPACFDAQFYLKTNAQDMSAFLKEPDAAALAWDHFLQYGYMEGRTHRFSC